MKTISNLLIFLLLGLKLFAQPDEYKKLIDQADSFLQNKSFAKAALNYSLAFESFGWKGYPDDRLKAAQAYAMSNNPDSAFFMLGVLEHKLYYSDYSALVQDPMLIPLHQYTRWDTLISAVKTNYEYRNNPKNKELSQRLNLILERDQMYRGQYNNGNKQNGIVHNIHEADSLNLVEVEQILQEYGWPDPKKYGFNAPEAVFLVIQHSELKTQEKYLPMMQEAVKQGKAQKSQIALLIDRIEIRNGRMQIYGSQVSTDADGKPFIKPIIDEKNVNKRRAEMGLEKLENYALKFGIVYKVPE